MSAAAPRETTSRILGIDPGSRITGYGIIDSNGQRSVHVASGCISMQGQPLPERLRIIYEHVKDVIAVYRPQEMAIELVFMHRNADSALKLGQARGAAIVAGVSSAMPVFEFTATQVKQAVVGVGHAAKDQVQHMVKVLLCHNEPLQADAADALAVALCHAHQRLTRVPVRRGAGRYRRPVRS